METLLIVEDDPDSASWIQETLAGAGYQVLAPVDSGPAALEAAAVASPSLVLMDVGLRGALDGIDTAHRLYTQYGTRVIYITAAADAATIQRVKPTAPLGYLEKPFSPRSLLRTVELGLHLAALEQQLAVRERLAAVGTIAAGMQHEINNPLTTVIANLEFIRETLVEAPQHGGALDLAELQSVVEDSLMAAARVRRTVGELRDISKLEDPVGTLTTGSEWVELAIAPRTITR